MVFIDLFLIFHNFFVQVFIDFFIWMLNQVYFLGIIPILLLTLVVLMFSKVCLPVSKREIVLYFWWLLVSLWGFGNKVMLFS